MTVALGPPPQDGKNPSLDRWMYLLWKRVMSLVAGVGAHSDLTGLQGGATGEYYHLTAAEYSALGTGGIVLNNVISTPTTIAADTSYPVVGYLIVNSTLTVDGNLAVI